jgi:hypothetical protein
MSTTPFSAATIIAKGFRAATALVRNPAAGWGLGKAAQAGAGHGIEIEGHGLAPGVTLIKNAAGTGKISQRPGVKGNEIVSGDIGPIPMYYRGIELGLALAFGTAGVPSLLSGTAYKHSLRLADDHRGKYATFVDDPFAEQDGPIWECPFLKITGFRLEAKQNEIAKLTLRTAGFGWNYNVGTSDPVTIVASVQPANGVEVIAAQPGKARKVHVRITDADASITEFILTFVGTDRDGLPISEVYQKTVNTLLWTSTKAFRTITSITASGFTGTSAGDTLEIFTAPIVRRVLPANGVLTLDAQPGEPSQLKITFTDANNSITEFILTVVGVDPDGNQITSVYQLTVNGGLGTNTYITNEVYASVTSITASGIAGAAGAGVDWVQVDPANGINNRTTMPAVTFPADRDLVVFGQLQDFLINDQAAGALTPVDSVLRDNDEFYPSSFFVDVNLSPTVDDVTTRFRTRIDEPVTGGAGHAETSFGFSFSKYDTRNHSLLKDQLSKGRKKAKVKFVGPLISGGGGFPFQLEIYINGLQFGTGAPSHSGVGVMPFDLQGMGHQVDVVPTGFPASLKEPIGIDLQTTLSTDPLA